MLRRAYAACSLDRARRSDFGFDGMGRLVAVPGLACWPDTFGFGFGCLVLGGEGMRGPPSFLLRESHISGKRAWKLVAVSYGAGGSHGHHHSQGHYDVNAKVPQGFR